MSTAEGHTTDGAAHGAQGVESMKAQTTQTYPWRFFIGPDGVVRTSSDVGEAEIRFALARHGLTDQVRH